MPLKKGTSDTTRSHNIAEMVRAGHDPKRAAAAAYRQQRESRRKKRQTSDAVSTSFALHDSVVLDAVHRSESGYLAADARCARVGTQRYRGSELGMPERDYVTLYRPEAEVFNRDAMHSMAHRPVTLKHPPVMVDSKNWAKYAKGHTLDPIVRDGEFVKVPIVLMDQAIIDAVESGGVRELSMGYTTDISWEVGETPEGEAYDGVQRAIRANHLALVPVARGGKHLRFGDADDDEDESQGASLSECPNCGAELTGDPITCPNCGYDLNPIARSDEDIEDFDSLPGASSASDAAAGGTREEGAMPITKQFDSVPINFADEVSAATMEREYKRLADAFEAFKKKSADEDNEDAEAKRKKVTAEDGLKKDIATRDGEIAVLKKQLADAGTLEARAEILARQRVAVLDAAKALLPKDFKDEGKTLTDIRRAALGGTFNDAEIKDWDDGKVEGAFLTLTKTGGGEKRGVTVMADSLSAGMRASGGYVAGNALADGEKQVNDAYNEYVKRTTEAYKKPFEVIRN